MLSLRAPSFDIDRLAIGLSALCMLHCLGTAVALVLISTLGGVFADPLIHEGGLLLATLFGAIAVARGVRLHGLLLPASVGALGIGMMLGALTMHHGEGEIVATLLGTGLLALGHDLNRRAVL